VPMLASLLARAARRPLTVTLVEDEAHRFVYVFFLTWKMRYALANAELTGPRRLKS